MCAIYTIEVKVTTPDGRSWLSASEIPAESLHDDAGEMLPDIIDEGGRLLDNLIMELMED